MIWFKARVLGVCQSAPHGFHAKQIRLNKEPAMPAKSKAQQKAAGSALAAKRGDQPVGKLKGASKQMERNMSERELEELAKTDRKSLPERKS
jgi:hypothetical protein